VLADARDGHGSCTSITDSAQGGIIRDMGKGDVQTEHSLKQRQSADLP
jgi:hypothetical protein